MDIVLIVLRLIHIVTAVTWFGLGLATFAFIAPADKLSGDSGLRFMKAVFTGTPLLRVFPIVSITATVAGILLYIAGSADHFSQTGNMVLGIGAVAGLLASGHGGMATGRYTGLYAEALTKHVGDKNEPVSAEALASIDAVRTKYMLHVRISFFLTAIALVFMATARYF